MSSGMGGPLPRVLAPATFLAARVYGAVVAARNTAFDAQRGVHTLTVKGVRIPVISVGNITSGGTGKSPFVAWLCGELAQMGMHPVIAMRGYRPHKDVGSNELFSDEAREYATTAPSATVVVGARRHEALTMRLGQSDCDAWRARAVVVLDDGFQHRALSRNLDIVLVDTTRPGLAGDVLPHGWLREPAKNLVRADLVVLTKVAMGDGAVDGSHAATVAAAELVRGTRGALPDACCAHHWSALDVYQDGVARSESVQWLASQRVAICCGLGNPKQFEASVRAAAGAVVRTWALPDHRALTASALESVLQLPGEAQACVISRKDLVKLDRLPAMTLVVPKLELVFDDGVKRLRAAVRRVVSA